MTTSPNWQCRARTESGLCTTVVARYGQRCSSCYERFLNSESREDTMTDNRFDSEHLGKRAPGTRVIIRAGSPGGCSVRAQRAGQIGEVVSHRFKAVKPVSICLLSVRFADGTVAEVADQHVDLAVPQVHVIWAGIPGSYTSLCGAVEIAVEDAGAPGADDEFGTDVDVDRLANPADLMRISCERCRSTDLWQSAMRAHEAKGRPRRTWVYEVRRCSYSSNPGPVVLGRFEDVGIYRRPGSLPLAEDKGKREKALRLAHAVADQLGWVYSPPRTKGQPGPRGDTERWDDPDSEEWLEIHLTRFKWEEPSQGSTLNRPNPWGPGEEGRGTTVQFGTRVRLRPWDGGGTRTPVDAGTLGIIVGYKSKSVKFGCQCHYFVHFEGRYDFTRVSWEELEVLNADGTLSREDDS